MHGGPRTLSSVTTPLVELEGPDARSTRDQALARALAVVSVLVLLFGLVGLVTVDPDDGGAPEGTPVAIVTSAAEKTFQSTARVSMNTELSFGGQGGASMLGEGVMDFEGGKSLLTLKAAGIFEMEMRTDGATVYMKVPQMGLAGAPTPWVAFDADEFTGSSGIEGFGANPASSSDPGRFLELLTSHEAVKEVVSIGPANVRGTATTGYRVTFDPAKLADTLGLDEDDDFELTGVDLVAETYVDDDGLVRRQVVRFGAPAEEGQLISFGMTMTMDFYDFGVEVDVEPPPADQVTRLDSPEDLDGIMRGGN